MSACAPTPAESPMTESNHEPYRHQPVLLAETLDLLMTDSTGLYLDCTLGLGGHSEAILQSLSPNGKLLGLDMDPSHCTWPLAACSRRNFQAVRSNFRDAARILE